MNTQLIRTLISLTLKHTAKETPHMDRRACGPGKLQTTGLHNKTAQREWVNAHPMRSVSHTNTEHKYQNHLTKNKQTEVIQPW